MRKRIYLIAFSIIFAAVCLFPHAIHAAESYFLSFSFLSSDRGVGLLSVKLLPGMAPKHLEQQSSNPILNIMGNDKTVLYQTRIEVPSAPSSAVNPLGIFFGISVPYIAGMATYELIGPNRTILVSGPIPSMDELATQLVVSPPPDIGLHKPKSPQEPFWTSPTVMNIIYASVGFAILAVLVTLFVWRRRIKRH